MSTTTASKILEQIKFTPPTLSQDGKSIILPKWDGFNVSLYGSSNLTVVDLDGRVYSPLFDTAVSVMYRVTNKKDLNDTAIDNFNEVNFIVPGLYKEQGENKKPQVLPTLREWKGDSGEFLLKDTSKIYYKDTSLKEKAEQIAFYFEKMLGVNIAISDCDGDIVLELSNNTELGSEGYYVEIEPQKVTISAPTEKGVLYGGTTITQILFDKKLLPCGIIRDYPQYPVRSLMIDLGRTFIQLDYMHEIARYMAYFKMNELHMHINDNGGETHTVFRIESKKFPQINANLEEGKIYRQEDYKAFQKMAESFGIDMVNEIDTPGHCAFLELYDKEISLNGMMDLTTEEKLQKSLKFIKELIDEMVDGEDPVFRGKRLHIGNDEYWVEGMHEQQRKYLNELIVYLNNKGITPQYWAVLGGEEGSGVTGKTPVSTDAVLNFWIDTATNPALMIEKGHKFINNDVREALYICPSNPYYGNQMRIDAKWNYENKNVNKVVGYEMPMASPLLLGYEPTFWNDCKSGISQTDVFESVKNAIMTTAEKAWQGKNTGEMTGDDFVALTKKFGKFAPGVNPFKYFEPNADGIIAKFDFACGLEDQSGNGHTVENFGAKKTEKGLLFDANSYITTDMTEVGYNSTISMDILIDDNVRENAVIFSSRDTKVYLNYEGTGKIGYERQGFKYSFPYVIDTGRMQNIKITTALIEDVRIEAGLCVDGVFVAKGYYHVEKLAHFNSSSLDLPLGKIGEGFTGVIGGITVLSGDTTADSMNGDGKICLKQGCEKIKATDLGLMENRVNDILAVFENAKQTENASLINLLAYRMVKLEAKEFLPCDTSALVQLLLEDISKIDYAPESFSEYELACLVAASVLCNSQSDQDAFDYAVKRIINAKEKLVISVPEIATVSTNREQWKENAVGNVLKDDDQLIYWQNGPQVPNDNITFKFSHPLELESFTLVSCGDDRLYRAEFQISKDGENYINVADLNDMEDQRTVNFEKTPVLSARIIIKDHSGKWIKIKKVLFNGGKLVDTHYLEKELARKIKESDYTAESYAEYKTARTEAEVVLASADKLQKDVEKSLLKLKKARIALKKA